MGTIIKSKRKIIMDMVCGFFGVTIEELRGQSISREITSARCVYSYLVRHHVGDSYSRIGSDLSKDHSTIVHQISKMQDFIYSKDPAALMMKNVEREIIKTFGTIEIE